MSVKKPIGVGLLATLVALVAMAFSAASAAASDANAEQSEPTTTCVYFLEPIAPVTLIGELPSTPASRGCYASMATAKAAIPAATVIIGEDFGHTTYGGAALVWTAAHGCVGYWYASGMPPEWNNRVRSAKGQSNCNRYRHWDGPNYGGAYKDCLPKCESMGVLEALTSSEQWFNN